MYILTRSLHCNWWHAPYGCFKVAQVELIMKIYFFLNYRDSDVSKINYMYAQYVKSTMEPLNIPDIRNLMSDQRFPWTVSNHKKNSFGNHYNRVIPFWGQEFSHNHSACMNLFSLYSLCLMCTEREWMNHSLKSLSFQSENPDSPTYHVKSLLCTPIRNGKKDKVIGKSDFCGWI